MNLKLRDIIYTTSDGGKFMKCSEGFIRGNNINSIQFREGILEQLAEERDSRLNNIQGNVPINFNRNYYNES